MKKPRFRDFLLKYFVIPIRHARLDLASSRIDIKNLDSPIPVYNTGSSTSLRQGYGPAGKSWNDGWG